MKRSTLSLLFFILSYAQLFAQRTDTLKFYSEAFKRERTIYVKTPYVFPYQAAQVKLPVFYILDGQHEWFVNPVQEAIQYLQYTHQIPQAIVVTIPLQDRVRECGIKSLDGDNLPLHDLITKEIETQLQKYRPNAYRNLIGHSFSASFALYSYLKAPEFYSAVIANSPLDQLEALMVALSANKKVDKSGIAISVGGIGAGKDMHHRKKYNELKERYQNFFKSITVFEADFAGHNAVPIVTVPLLLTRQFDGFSERYNGIARVNDEYKLISKPDSVKAEMQKIRSASTLGSYFYPPELADINGIASRYANSDAHELAANVYSMGLEFYPYYYDFHLSLVDILQTTNRKAAVKHLIAAEGIVNELVTDPKEREEVLAGIAEKRKGMGL